MFCSISLYIRGKRSLAWLQKPMRRKKKKKKDVWRPYGRVQVYRTMAFLWRSHSHMRRRRRRKMPLTSYGQISRGSLSFQPAFLPYICLYVRLGISSGLGDKRRDRQTYTRTQERLFGSKVPPLPHPELGNNLCQEGLDIFPSFSSSLSLSSDMSVTGSQQLFPVGARTRVCVSVKLEKKSFFAVVKPLHTSLPSHFSFYTLNYV